ncbi:helix-turn-helix domain-containing protein, partial [Enterococcus faecalis]
RYTSVLELSNDLVHRVQNIVLGLKSGLPVLEEERVKISIENKFRRFYALEVLRYSEARKEEWQNFDLLLVTSLGDVKT